MNGFICKKEVLSHPLLVIGGFGFSVFFHAIIGHGTFLEIVTRYGK
jgi:hypothetical protein